MQILAPMNGRNEKKRLGRRPWSHRMTSTNSGREWKQEKITSPNGPCFRVPFIVLQSGDDDDGGNSRSTAE